MKGEQTKTVGISKLSRKDTVLGAEKKINYQLSKSSISDIDLYEVYRFFFKNYYDLDYEFSAQELLDELDKNYIEEKLKNDIIDIVGKISVIEYKDKSLGEKELRRLFQKLLDIVKRCDTSETISRSGFFRRWKAFFHKEPRPFNSLPIDKKLKKAKKEHDRGTAREMYLVILEEYEGLNDADKKKYYKKIMKLHDKLIY